MPIPAPLPPAPQLTHLHPSFLPYSLPPFSTLFLLLPCLFCRFSRLFSLFSLYTKHFEQLTSQKSIWFIRPCLIKLNGVAGPTAWWNCLVNTGPLFMQACILMHAGCVPEGDFDKETWRWILMWANAGKEWKTNRGKKNNLWENLFIFFRLLWPNLTVVVCQRKNSKTSTARYNKTGLKTSGCVELCESQSSNKTHKHTQVWLSLSGHMTVTPGLRELCWSLK